MKYHTFPWLDCLQMAKKMRVFEVASDVNKYIVVQTVLCLYTYRSINICVRLYSHFIMQMRWLGLLKPTGKLPIVRWLDHEELPQAVVFFTAVTTLSGLRLVGDNYS